jgi:formylglycine-generating enzyme required for sulfatase activity
VAGHVACASIVGEDYHVVEGADAGTAGGATACPTNLMGPPLVPVATEGTPYCIDSTEVTSADYEAWLKTSPDPGSLSQVCAWKADFTPNGTWPKPFDERDIPVSQIDWCDAYAYCAGVGKRLCGAIGGGPDPYGDPDNPLTSMWFRACTEGGTRDYPYDGAYDPEACIGADYGAIAAAEPQPVKSAGRCVGGVPGLWDMAGNVNEWADSCNGDTGATDNCRWRGGSFQSVGPEPRCDTNEGNPARETRSLRIGIRCCFDAP